MQVKQENGLESEMNEKLQNILKATWNFYSLSVFWKATTNQFCYGQPSGAPKTSSTQQPHSSKSVDCSCPAGHSEFTWHTDYTVQHGDTWESVSEKFPPFVVEKPDKTLIVSQTISLDLVCGCSKGVEVVSYRVESGDALFTICSRFNTMVNKTAELNKLDNPRLIYVGDVIFIPE